MRKTFLPILGTLSIVTAGLAVTGCVSTSRVFEVAPGIYSVTTTGDGFSTASRTRDHVLGSATDFCAKQGKHVLVENDDQSHTRMGIDTTIDVRFQCVAELAALP
jgi:hypothetical protein